MAKLCARGKAAAKRKFKVYPSAYANMYASAVCSGKVTPGGRKGKANGGMLSAGATLDKRKRVITKNKTNLSQQRKAVSNYAQGGIAKGCGDVLETEEKLQRSINMANGLREWVQEKWVDIGARRKDGSYPPCGRSKGEKRKGYPKCVPLAKARAMSEGQRRSAVQRKRAAGNTGPKPTNVATFAKRKKMQKGGDVTGQKYYEQAKEKQKKFKESEKKLDENYKKVRQEEMDAEKYARLLPEDSTREYNPVEHYKLGGLVSRGQGRTFKTKKTKIY